jgi:hypothetical protein
MYKVQEWYEYSKSGAVQTLEQCKRIACLLYIHYAMSMYLRLYEKRNRRSWEGGQWRPMEFGAADPENLGTAGRTKVLLRLTLGNS